MHHVLKGSGSVLVWCSREVHRDSKNIRDSNTRTELCFDFNQLWPSWPPSLCLQVCAIVSLLPTGSLADLTCEALLMLSGNISCKFRTSTFITEQAYFSVVALLNWFSVLPTPEPLNIKPSSSFFSLCILADCCDTLKCSTHTLVSMNTLEGYSCNWPLVIHILTN